MAVITANRHIFLMFKDTRHRNQKQKNFKQHRAPCRHPTKDQFIVQKIIQNKRSSALKLILMFCPPPSTYLGIHLFKLLLPSGHVSPPVMTSINLRDDS